MKTKTRGKFALLGVFLLLLGSIIWAVGMSGLKWNFLELDTIELIDKQAVFTQNETVALTKIDIDVDCNLSLRKSQDGQLKVDYFEYETFEVKVAIEDDTLQIRSVDKRKWHDYVFKPMFSGLKASLSEMVVYLPDLEYQSAKVITGNGNIKIDSLRSDSLYLETDNGRQELKDTSFGTLSMTSYNGDIDIVRASGTKVTIKVHNGDVELEEVTISDELVITSYNGDLELEKLKVKTMQLKTHNGRIEAEHLDCITATLISYNGDVELEVEGKKSDYKLKLTTHNGSASPKPYEQPQVYTRSLDITTHNGDIEVKFD